MKIVLCLGKEYENTCSTTEVVSSEIYSSLISPYAKIIPSTIHCTSQKCKLPVSSEPEGTEFVIKVDIEDVWLAIVIYNGVISPTIITNLRKLYYNDDGIARNFIATESGFCTIIFIPIIAENIRYNSVCSDPRLLDDGNTKPIETCLGRRVGRFEPLRSYEQDTTRDIFVHIQHFEI